jgi:hypothetical protein
MSENGNRHGANPWGLYEMAGRPEVMVYGDLDEISGYVCTTID